MHRIFFHLVVNSPGRSRIPQILLLTLSVISLCSGESVFSGCPPPAPSPDWKGDVQFPLDDFSKRGDAGDPTWIKFTILTCDPTRIYFQNSRTYPFHYNFARDHLPPFSGMSSQEFDKATLHGVGQQAVLGAVLLPGLDQWGREPLFPEYGIQLVRRDPYAPREAIDYLELVRNHVLADPGIQVHYFPTFEQLESALKNRSVFEANGFSIGSMERWTSGNRCYSEGWALGTLKFFTADLVGEAFHQGDLTTGDILLTDGVPSDTPLVAGLISLAPATPNSHVAILAKTFQIPFAHLKDEADVSRAQDLVGRRIVFRAYESQERCDLRLIDTEDQLTGEQAAEILALKAPPALNIQPITPLGSYGAPTDGLGAGDIRHFGGKAANFGYLRRALPDSSPVSAAISMDLWIEFLDQEISGGVTLGQHIDGILSRYSYPPADLQAFADDLDDIRGLFKDDQITRFTPRQRDGIIDLLQDPRYGFHPHRKIRFRSSTNVEDSDQFTGAGLYGSWSGCLADELDGDDEGPSLCDETEAGERGVFRAIRKVFASFYNESAVLERMRHGVNEHQVGMAVLVHHSFPDEIELANGVATLSQTGGLRRILLVSQVGAHAVTNPEEGTMPEEVAVRVTPGGPLPELVRSSNLTQLGATVLEWTSEYVELSQLLLAAASQFQAERGKTEYVLDFEYKKADPGAYLVVKQIREIPWPGNEPSITPFLINEPMEFQTAQVEDSSVFGNHRLKSRWVMETKSLWLTPENLEDSFYSQISLEYHDGCAVRVMSGDPATFQDASYGFEEGTARNRWALPDLANPRTLELETMNVPTLVAPSESPVLTQRDFGRPAGEGLLRRVDVTHQTPVLTWREGIPGHVFIDREYMWIRSPYPESSRDVRVVRELEGPGGISITTGFYWPPIPPGIVGGYTNPLARWDETVIEGLTSEPMVLHGFYSGSYRPGHHNQWETVIFQPRLEPGMPEATLEELAAKNIHQIQVIYGAGSKPPGDELQVVLLSGCAVGDPCGCAKTPFLRGDADGNGGIDISDVISTLNYLFISGTRPGCLDAADVDDDGDLSLTDAIRSLNYQFTGTAPAPEPPGPFDCGMDPTADELTCESFQGCDVNSTFVWE